MSIQFSESVIKNNKSLDIEVLLEVPIGTLFTSEKITVKASGHEDFPDFMFFDTNRVGNPHKVYIEKINASTAIGLIRGSVSANF